MQKQILTALTLAALALTGCNSNNRPNGYIDKSGTVLVEADKIDPKPIGFGDYSQGYGIAPVQFAKGWGAIDKAGKVIFQKPYRLISPFYEGKSAYCVGQNENDLRWGFINTKGEDITSPTFLGAGRFSEGVAPVRLPAEANPTKATGDWTYIDETGKRVLNQTFHEAQPFYEGVAVVKEHGRMGCIDKRGTFVVPPTYDAIYPCNDGTIVAAMGNGLTGDSPGQQLDYFDKKGTKLLHKEMKPITLQNLRPPMWVLSPSANKEKDEALVRPLSNSVTPGFSEGKSISQAGTKFCIDQQFNARAFAGGYDYIFPVSDGFMVVYNDADGGKMDYRGGVPADAPGIWNNKKFRFYDAAPFSDGLGLVQETKNGPYGYVDKSGEYVIKPTFDHARPFHDGRALVGDAAEHYVK